MARTLEIPDSELSWRFSRSGGPGGQSVNTADSRVELSWDVANTSRLGADAQGRGAGSARGPAGRRRVDGGGVRAPLAIPEPPRRRGTAPGGGPRAAIVGRPGRAVPTKPSRRIKWSAGWRARRTAATSRSCAARRRIR